MARGTFSLFRLFPAWSYSSDLTTCPWQVSSEKMVVMISRQSRRGIRGAKIAWLESQGWYWAGFAPSSEASADLSALVNYTGPAQAHWGTSSQRDRALYMGCQWTFWCVYWAHGSASDWQNECCAQKTIRWLLSSSFSAFSSEVTQWSSATLQR